MKTLLVLLATSLLSSSAFASDHYLGTEILKHLQAGQYQGHDSNDQDCFVYVTQFDGTDPMVELTIFRVGPGVQLHPGDDIAFNNGDNTKLVSTSEDNSQLQAVIQTVPNDGFSGVYRNWLSIQKTGDKIELSVKTARRFLGMWTERKHLSCTLASPVNADTHWNRSGLTENLN